VRLAADANVLLSAVVGGRARDVLTHPRIDGVVTTATTLGEVQEYLSYLARKKRLALDTVLLAAASLPVTVVERAVYAAKIAEATKRLGRRDPDDVDLLALALHEGIPVWSNDNDFEDAGVEWFTTAALLKALDTKA
jgi:predicted nucleic acid-binding protein